MPCSGWKSKNKKHLFYGLFGPLFFIICKTRADWQTSIFDNCGRYWQPFTIGQQLLITNFYADFSLYGTCRFLFHITRNKNKTSFFFALLHIASVHNLRLFATKLWKKYLMKKLACFSVFKRAELWEISRH